MTRIRMGVAGKVNVEGTFKGSETRLLTTTSLFWNCLFLMASEAIKGLTSALLSRFFHFTDQQEL